MGPIGPIRPIGPIGEGNLATLLALDWDSREFHLVQASVGRGKVHIQQAIHWREEEPFIPANAEAFGQELKQRLASAGIAAAPLIVGLGRQRLVVKEVRFPDVGPEVEAAIVRNQIIKELTETPEDVLLDYLPLPEPGKNGQRRAISLVVRKDVVQGIQTVCQVAGLKLLAVTARPFGIAACFKHLAGVAPQVPAPPTLDAVSAILTVSEGWAEFCAVRGQQLVYSRAATPGDGLVGEVRRNLAAYSGQPQLTFPRDAIQAMYVSGNGDNVVLREALRDTLGIPVHGLDPFAADSHVQILGGNKAGFTGAVGLLHLWATDAATPVNFVKPREVKPVVDPRRRRVIVFSTAGVIAFVGLIVAGFMLTESKKEEIRELTKTRTEKENQVKEIEPELQYLSALRDYANGSISWLDELYDLVARAPLSAKEGKFRITSMTATALDGKAKAIRDKGAKGKAGPPAMAQLTLVIEASRKDEPLVQQLINKINLDTYCQVYEKSQQAFGNITTDPTKATWKHTLKIAIAHRSPSAYHALIPVSRRQPVLDDDDAANNAFVAPEIANGDDQEGEAQQ
jgi:Tfp pilus assembly PilM family ATPase